MAVTAHERVGDATRTMEKAIYDALDAIDAYSGVVRGVIAEQEATGEPNAMLVKRMGQFADRADTMVKIIEDDVLTQLMFCLDRLFAVKLAEDGEFI